MYPALVAYTLLLAASSLRTVKCISVPTGKETPISPATSTTPAPIPRISRVPAPVFEYTDENPEPAPLDPSYKPISYKYLNVLTPNAIYYVPVRFRVPNYNNDFSDVSYKPKYNVKVLEYQLPRRPQQYNFQTAEEYRQPENNQDYFFRKLVPSKGVSQKAAFGKEYLVRQQEWRPTKGGYPKKATAYQDHGKHFYQYLHKAE